MENWFECKVKYEQLDEYGKETPVSESYMIDALTFTEAESRLIKLVAGVIPSEFIVTGISKAKLSEVVPAESADYWYKCKVVFKDIDEKSGKEKSSANQILVAADDFKSALQNLEKSLEGTLVPWEIQQMALTKVADVFPYNSEEKELEGRTPLSALSDDDRTYIDESEK